MSWLIDAARNFAIGAHEAVGQKRKFTGEPYWHHVDRVASLVYDVGGSQFAIAAAWLHDTVEDTQVTIDTIYDCFGFIVGEHVKALTNDKTLPTRSERKADEIQRFAGVIHPETQTIKLADILDNGRCFLKSGDKDKIDLFMREKSVLVEHLRNGNPKLLAEVDRMLANYFYDKD